MRNSNVCAGNDNRPLKVYGSEYDDTHGLMLLLFEFLIDDAADGGIGDVMSTVTITSETDGSSATKKRCEHYKHRH